jgi:hypothetical protein
MANVFRATAMVLVLVPLASGCSSVPRWDWWRSAQTGPPPGAMVAENLAPKSEYPKLPSATTTPSNLTASNASSTPPGTSAPENAYPSTNTSTSSSAMPTSYPSTAATGAYPSTAGGYAPQTGSYDANAYNSAAGATGPAAHVASNPNAYGGSVPQYNPTAGVYPPTNSPAAYPNTQTGGYDSAPASYGAPAAGPAPYNASQGADPNGYRTGSPYDAPAADRYGAGTATSTAPNYGAPAATSYPPANNYQAPAGAGYPPANNYGPPAAGGYPAAPADGGYRGGDATAPSSSTNYAAAPGAASDRYPSYDQAGSTAGPVATTADSRTGTTPVSAPHYDSAVTPASGGSYLPAGTKLLEGEMPSTPAATPGSSTPSSTPYGYQNSPGSMG